MRERKGERLGSTGEGFRNRPLALGRRAGPLTDPQQLLIVIVGGGSHLHQEGEGGLSLKLTREGTEGWAGEEEAGRSS